MWARLGCSISAERERHSMTPRSDKKARCSRGSLLAAEKITAVDRVVSLGAVIPRNLVLFQTCRSGRDR